MNLFNYLKVLMLLHVTAVWDTTENWQAVFRLIYINVVEGHNPNL